MRHALCAIAPLDRQWQPHLADAKAICLSMQAGQARVEVTRMLHTE
jgi:hypothetical protein